MKNASQTLSDAPSKTHQDRSACPAANVVHAGELTDPVFADAFKRALDGLCAGSHNALPKLPHERPGYYAGLSLDQARAKVIADVNAAVA